MKIIGGVYAKVLEEQEGFAVETWETRLQIQLVLPLDPSRKIRKFPASIFGGS